MQLTPWKSLHRNYFAHAVYKASQQLSPTQLHTYFFSPPSVEWGIELEEWKWENL